MPLKSYIQFKKRRVPVHANEWNGVPTLVVSISDLPTLLGKARYEKLRVRIESAQNYNPDTARWVTADLLLAFIRECSTGV